MARDHQPTPSIVRPYGKSDANVEVISTPLDRVTHSRGFGDSGYRIEVVDHDCPKCDFDRMVRRHDVRPDERDEVRYWCLYPNCVHYVGDSMSYAFEGSYPQRDASKPTIFESAP